MRRGRVFKRGASWCYVVDLAPKGAPREQKMKGGFPRKEDAVEALARLQTEKKDGKYIEPTKLTVEAYLETWLAGKNRIRATTLTTYQLAVRRLIPLIGKRPLQQLTRADIKAAYVRLSEQLTRRKKAPSAKTVHNVHLALHTALEEALQDGLIARNPADRAHQAPRRGEQAEMKVWTGEELRRFLTAVQDHDLYPLLRLAAYTGMRRGELLGLRWADVNFDGGFLSVHQQVSRETVAGVTTWAIVPTPKSSAGRRRIDIDDVTMAALHRLKASQAKLRLELGLGANDEDLVFARADGRWLDPDVVTATFERLPVKAGVPRIRFHDVRHSHASLSLIAGVPVHVVSKRLGHANPAVTLTIYAHVIPAAQRDAAERFAAAVDAP